MRGRTIGKWLVEYIIPVIVVTIILLVVFVTLAGCAVPAGESGVYVSQTTPVPNTVVMENLGWGVTRMVDSEYGKLCYLLVNTGGGAGIWCTETRR